MIEYYNWRNQGDCELSHADFTRYVELNQCLERVEGFDCFQRMDRKPPSRGMTGENDETEESAVFDVLDGKICDPYSKDEKAAVRREMEENEESTRRRRTKINAMQNSWSSNPSKPELSRTTVRGHSAPGAIAVRGPGARDADDSESEYVEDKMDESEVFGLEKDTKKLVVAAEVVEDDTDELKAALARQKQEMEKLRTALKQSSDPKLQQARNSVGSQISQMSEQEQRAMSLLLGKKEVKEASEAACCIVM